METSGTNPKKALFRTAELMKLAGVGRNTLRFYEERGLLRTKSRTESGYRIYDREALADIKFIQEAKTAGLTLEEIKELLDIARVGTVTCGTVSKKITQKLAAVESAMLALTRKKALLESFLGKCGSQEEKNRCDVRSEGIRVSACCG